MNNYLNKIAALFLKFHKHIASIVGILLLATVIELFSFSSKEKLDDKSYSEYFNANYKVFGVNIPKDLNFAGEGVPINDFTVRESIDRELLVNTYFQSQTILIHKRANRWFPVIEPILKKNGIPDDFKYIALIESNLSNVVSPKGATGFWQLIEGTAKYYNLEINEEVDERYNVEKSTEAACKYFQEAYEKFGSWTLAAASYNLGMGGIENQLKKQKANNFYDLLLNEETSRYIFRILSTKEIISKPSNYGYILRKKDLYPSLQTYKIKIDSSVTDLADFAISQGISYKILKTFNPWLRKNYLKNSNKKTYEITLPKNGFNEAYFADMNNEEQNTLSSIDTSKSIQPTFKPKPDVIHIIKEGETISSIAKQYKISNDQLKMWNLLPEHEQLKVGQELVIFLKNDK